MPTQIDPEEFRLHLASLSGEALLDIDRDEPVDVTQKHSDEEPAQRGTLRGRGANPTHDAAPPAAVEYQMNERCPYDASP